MTAGAPAIGGSATKHGPARSQSAPGRPVRWSVYRSGEWPYWSPRAVRAGDLAGIPRRAGGHCRAFGRAIVARISASIAAR